MPKADNRHNRATFVALGTTFAAWLVGMALAATALAAPLDDAKAAYLRSDFATAFRLFQPLSDAGSYRAMFYLGVMYEDGAGVKTDSAKGMKLIREAAEHGDAEAENFIGRRYYIGWGGFRQDDAEALKWFRKAANQGNPGAQNNLGLMYVKGAGVVQDYVQAHMWFNLAAAQLSAEPEDREKAINNRDAVAAKMTRAQIAEAQKLAREWKPK